LVWHYGTLAKHARNRGVAEIPEPEIQLKLFGFDKLYATVPVYKILLGWIVGVINYCISSS